MKPPISCFTARKAFSLTGANGDVDAVEAEANEWAARSLLPSSAWQRFLAANAYRSEDAIRSFAAEQEIAPAIIVGRLQHEKLLPWGSRLNRLKVRLEWTDD